MLSTARFFGPIAEKSSTGRPKSARKTCPETEKGDGKHSLDRRDG
jgi:hypothetical protein